MAIDTFPLSLGSGIVLSVPVGYYCYFLLRSIRHFGSEAPVAGTSIPSSVSIVVPARNEEATIESTLRAIDRQVVGPLEVEVVVVDDHSEDATSSVVNDFIASEHRLAVRLVRLREVHSKKAAIAQAVSTSTAEWICTVDADVVIASDRWLASMIGTADQDTSLVCGPVLMVDGKFSLFSRIAALESFGLATISAAFIRLKAPLICNGANLAFRRQAFLQSGGYSDKSATGDDTDLLFRIAPQRIRFSHAVDALVQTEAPGRLKDYLSQRQRWASKIPHSMARRVLGIGFMAWLAHFSLLAGMVMAMCAVIPVYLPAALLAIKSVFEYRVLITSARAFQKRLDAMLVLMLQPVYCLSITVIGILAVFFPFRWKGRTSDQ